MNTIALSPLSIFENQYRAVHDIEHALLLDAQGQVVIVRDGDDDSVSFQPGELQQGIGGILTHSHPRCLPPSGADLALAAAYALTLRAFGTAPDTGQQFDHTVVMPGRSEQMARYIERHFDDEVEIAEKQLAALPLGDLQWQRESRHLAVQRLAQRCGFEYERIERRKSISETTQHEQKRIGVLASVTPVMSDQFFVPFRDSLVRALVRQADASGRIPPERLDAIRQLATAHVQRAFLGVPLRDGTLTPYTVDRGEVAIRSSFFRVLWDLMRTAAAAAIERHASIMRKHLPADLVRAYEFATVNPFDEALHEAESDTPLYDPLHLWVGPDGKRLSDRIWNVAGDMRRKLDQYLTIAIAQRTDVATMAKELEQFLMPGAGTFEAMRLARTETSAAYHRADSAAAQGNPFVETYQPFTAPEHACCDNCDEIVKAGPYDKADVAYLPPYHAHCICGVLWNLVSDGVVIRLRQQIEQALSAAKTAITDVIGPLSRRFLDLLFRGH